MVLVNELLESRMCSDRCIVTHRRNGLECRSKHAEINLYTTNELNELLHFAQNAIQIILCNRNVLVIG